MKRNHIPLTLSCFFLLGLFLALISKVEAQSINDTYDQTGFLNDEGREDSNIDNLLEELRNRAKAKINQKQTEKLRKIKVSASVTGGYETNPLNSDADTSTEESDSFIEERANINWLPTFTDIVGADIGYHFYNQNYSDQTQLDSTVHSTNAELKFYPNGEKYFSIHPGVEYEWVDYQNDDTSVYEAVSPYIKLRYNPDSDWSFGLKGEFTDKWYDSRLARNNLGTNITNLTREDERYTAEISATRYLGDYFIRLKARAYHNDSNDAFQSFYDYASYRAQATLGASFLKDHLDLSFSPSYEKRDYDEQVAGSETREDDIFQAKIDAKYKITQNLSIDYGLSDRISDSNVAGGDYTNIINTLGISAKF